MKLEIRAWQYANEPHRIHIGSGAAGEGEFHAIVDSNGSEHEQYLYWALKKRIDNHQDGKA